MAPDLHTKWMTFRSAPDEAAFTPLYDASKNLVYTICYRILRNQDDAHDAFQATYARLIQVTNDPDAAGQVTDAAQLIRYLAVREADNLRKRRSRRLHREIAMEALPPNAHDTNLSPSDIAANRQLREQVETIVSTLPERYRVPVLLHYFNGMTHQEIAQALGEPRSTITRRIARALKKLQPIMRRAGLGEASATLSVIMATSALLSPPASWAAGAVFASASAGAGAGAAVIATSAELVGGAAAASGKAAATGLAAIKGWIAAGAAAVVIGGGVIVATLLPPGAATRGDGAMEQPITPSSAVNTFNSTKNVGGEYPDDVSATSDNVTGQAVTADKQSHAIPTIASSSSLLVTSADLPESQNSSTSPDTVAMTSLPIRVFWEKTGDAVAGTTVTLTQLQATAGEQPLIAHTDAKGEATLSHPAAWNAVSLKIVGQPAAKNPAHNITLPQTPPLAIALQRGASVYGSVLIQGTNKPAAGAMVNFFRDNKLAYAAADGSFEIFNVESNEVRPFARMGSLLSFLTEDEIDAFPVIEGMRNGPINIIVKPVLALEGRVTNKQTGRPLEGVEVHAGVPYLMSKTDKDGRYRLDGFFVNRYEIFAEADGFTEQNNWVEMSDKSENRLDFAMEKGVSLTVTVVDGEGNPLVGAQVSNDLDFNHISLGKTDAKGMVTTSKISRSKPGLVYALKDGYQTADRKPVEFESDTEAAPMRLVLTKVPEFKGGFKGVVRNEKGDPLAAVRVQYRPNWQFGGQGDFFTDTNERGEYQLEVTKSDTNWVICAFVHGRAPEGFKNFVPGPADAPTIVNFTLGPAHWLDITVTDGKKNPISEGHVYVRQTPDQHTNKNIIPGIADYFMLSAGVNSHVENLPAGSVSVEVDAPGFTRYEDVHAVDQAITVELKAAGVIKGRVVDAESGKPIDTFNVKTSGNYIESRRVGEGENFTDNDGRFILRELNAGSNYSLTIDAENYAPKYIKNVIAGSVAEDGTEPEEIIVKMSRGAEFRGRLVDAETGGPIANVTIHFALFTSPDFVNWQTLESSSAGRMRGYQSATTDEAGRFAFMDAIEGGSLIIRVNGYARQVIMPEEMSQYQTFAGDTVGGTPGQEMQSEGVLIPLTRAATLRGAYVIGGAPQIGVRMSLSIDNIIVNGRQRYHYIESPTTDAQGRFEWSGLAAGNYMVSPMKQRSNISFGSFSVKVALAAGEDKELNLGAVLGSHTMSGRVMKDSQIIGDASINLSPLFACPISNYNDRSLNDGRYSFFGLHPGRYQLRAYMTGPQGQIQNDFKETITISGNLERDINLAGQPRVTGRLVFDPAMPADVRSQFTMIAIMRANLSAEDIQAAATSDIQHFGNGSIAPDGSIEIYGRFKGAYTLMLGTNRNGGMSTTVTIPKPFEIDTMAGGDAELGDIEVPVTSSLRVISTLNGGKLSEEYGVIFLNEGEGAQSQSFAPHILEAGNRDQVISVGHSGSVRAAFFAIGFRVEPNMIPITFEPGQTATAQITLTPTGTIAGNVSAKDGETVRQANPSRVTLRGEGEERVLTAAGTLSADVLRQMAMGEDVLVMGAFYFQNVKNGQYEVSIEAEGYKPLTRTYNVTASAPFDDGPIFLEKE